MLVECGFVRATISRSGEEYTFRPSLGRIAALGDPEEIVALFAALHGENAAQEAAYVLAGLCDQDDPTPLIGWHDEAGWHAGAMPSAEQIIVARHLMRHGMVGKARPEQPESGGYSTRFDASEYVATARVHLGLSTEDAEALSMTELQDLLEMKFPSKAAQRDVPTKEEYEAAWARVEEIRRGR